MKKLTAIAAIPLFAGFLMAQDTPQKETQTETTTTTKTTTTPEGEQTTAEIPQTLLTLSVSKEEAEKVTFAAANGEVVLGLRTPDSTVKSGQGITYSNVFK